MTDVLIRPLRPEDVSAVGWLSETASHLLHTDPGGCWVAERDGRPIGAVVSAVREVMWVLASYAVLPAHHGRGVGDQLLAAAAHHGRGCTRAASHSSADQRAVRRHHAAGFTLHPTMSLSGTVDHALLPIVDHVRDGTASDIELMDSIARRARGAAHGPDHDWLMAEHRLLVLDRPSGSGFVYIGDDGPVLLAATRRRTAARLLVAALASCSPGRRVRVTGITGANPWVLDVGLPAGLALHHDGYLALSGTPPPPAYLAHAALL